MHALQDWKGLWEKKRTNVWKQSRRENESACVCCLYAWKLYAYEVYEKKIKIQSNLIKEKVLSRRLVSYERSWERAFYFLAFHRLFLYRDIFPCLISFHYPFIHSRTYPSSNIFFIFSFTRSFLRRNRLAEDIFDRWHYEINIFNDTTLPLFVGRYNR